MSARELITALESRGVRMRVHRGRLQASPPHLLSAEDLSRIDASRSQLVALLAPPIGPAPESAPSIEPPALAHRRRLGWSHEQFGALCRRLIGKPGPSTWAEDCRVAAELARIPTPPTAPACSATPPAEERPLRGSPASAADTVPTHEVSLLSVANRYRAAFGTSMVAALREVTGCDFNQRNPTREELTLFAAWLDASALRPVAGTATSSIPQTGNAEEGNP